MSIDIIRGSTKKVLVSKLLVETLSSRSGVEGRLFLGYPIARSSIESHSIDALWVSKTYGVLAFDLIEGESLEGYEDRQDDMANQLEIQLRTDRRLMNKRELKVNIHVATFTISEQLADLDDEYPVLIADSLTGYLNSVSPIASDEEAVYELVLSNLENVSRLGRRRVPRRVTRDDTRGAKLKELENTIATLDDMQSKSVLETVEGVQRIRGLAGSGKTIVLALKVAYLHSQNPDWRIAVTFHTRSLKAFFTRLIRDFHIDKTGEEPDWRNVRVVNAWGAAGGQGRDGIYYEFCLENEIEYLDFGSARSKFGYDDAFKGACEKALEESKSQNKRVYDAILVDEAQDLPSSFLKLCRRMLKAPKRLVYAYDELQNLTDEPVPSPELIFGDKEDGQLIFSLGENNPRYPTQDLILRKCYRNPRPLLVTAHAVGFGVYRAIPEGDTIGLVQMFDYPELWEAVGYEVIDGILKEGENVTLKRSESTSPLQLESHSPPDDLVKFEAFIDEEEQTKWISTSIANDLENEELSAADIMVINLDSRYNREGVGPLRAELMSKKIHTHLAGVDTSPDVFALEDTDSITFTGIHRAKGNEAAMVYIMNAHSGMHSPINLASNRNKLFTAITRSKAWVRVTGIGDTMRNLKNEFEAVKENDFSLQFRYPTFKDRKKLRTIHRDRSKTEQRRIENRNNKLNEILKEVNSGALAVEDLDPEVVRALHVVFGDKSA